MKHLPALVAFLLCAVVGCTTDQPKGASADAGSPTPAIVDAGAPRAADAGLSSPPADAGPAIGAAAVGVDAGQRPTAPVVDDVGAAVASSVYDRILAKPREQGQDPQELKAAVEKRTGLRIKLARRTAGTWVMFQLEPAAGGRDEADQRRAIEKLRGTGLFLNVEGDRLMKLKTP